MRAVPFRQRLLPRQTLRPPGEEIHRRLLRRRTLFGSGLNWLEWSYLTVIYGVLFLAMCFFGATLRPYHLRNDLYAGPTLIYSSDGQVLARFYDEYRVPVTLSQVPRSTIYAILASEDMRFFKHRGLDARGIARAFWHDIRSGSLDQGGSTITQQLVRYELLDNRRSLVRKMREAVLAVRIERTYTKQQILERYLNAIYFGDGAYGIGAAAQSYFRKPVSKLTPAEGAILAGLIRSPEEGNLRDNYPIARRRQLAILATMLQQGWLSRQQYNVAVKEHLVIHQRRKSAWRAPYAVETVREDLIARYGREAVYRGGMRVYTTIDSRMQRVAERALSRAIDAGRSRRVGNGALVSIEPATGFIRAIVGGANFYRSPFNRALQAHRQPGSAFKVFVYQAALEAGHSLNDPILDAPVAIGGWSPKNYGNQYHGIVTLQEALANSMNSAAVRLVAEMSPYAVISAARQAGISSPLPPNLTIALGTAEVTPLEMSCAFATYATGGVYVEPSFIKSIYFQEQLLFRITPVPRQQVNPVTAFLLTQGLRSVITEGTGRRAQIGRPAAGKTGTSNDFRDAWFVGYTPDLSTAVWLGNDDRRPMRGVAGGSLPAQAWAEYMRAALRGTRRTDFIPPVGVIKVDICTVSGQLALPSCPSTRGMYVAAAHMPARTCQRHYFVTRTVCTVTGDLPNATCPRANRTMPYFDAPDAQCPVDHRAQAPAPAEELTQPDAQVEPSVPTPVPQAAPPWSSLRRWLLHGISSPQLY